MCIIRLEALSDFVLSSLLVLVSYRQLKRGFEHTRRVFLIEYFNDKIASLPLLARRLILVDFGPGGQQRPSRSGIRRSLHT